MNSIKYKIDSLYSNNINYIIIPDKKKKNNFNIKDGFITYIITLSDSGINCQCGKYMCNHILYLLHIHFYLDYFSIYYLTFIRYQKLLAPKMIKGYGFIEKEINKMITETECGICYNNLTLKDLYICNSCCNMVHESCMNKWIIAQKNNKSCIYCNL